MPSVFITGASSGIGYDASLRMARRGWTTFGGVRNDADADRLIEESNGTITPITCDVTDSAQIDAARSTILSATGGSLTGLVNNAGIAVAGPIELVSASELRAQFDVNVFGHAAVTQAFIPALRAEGGRIVNISSVGGLFSPPLLGPYSMAKFALEAMSDSLRRELKPSGIKVSVIEPARIQTRIWEKSLADSGARLAAMDEGGRKSYGKMTDGLLRNARSPEGDPVELVSDAIEHALTARRPKIRYPVGNEAKVLSVVTRLVPHRILDRVDPFA